ncbi:hypothetical protein [Mucilaginibacter glaciei]|uniref:GIY-YIG domain-containing protein n=1 Tax=Mucilaginibacter glaciei TaxID=2772109 RepID=A0A926S4G8_9SPHI|nr:hypothetical protein [Mucilaginibacter glaciei]MBD1395244.1 hypothetical protein [Mucilaginibacter glaciei]
MLNSAFDLGEELRLREISYKLHQTLWDPGEFSKIDLDLKNWTTFKYLNDDGSDFNADIKLLPQNSGGIYMFSIKCPVIPGMTDFPVYIGRALYTKGQNLEKRCKEYFQKYARSGERPKITRMFHYWAHDLHLNFMPLEDNQEIANHEKFLINALLLPFNDQIPDMETRQAVKAFNL